MSYEMGKARERHLDEEELELFLALPDDEARAEPPAEWRHHVELCERCQGELASLRAVHRALGDLPELAPSPGFAEAVMARVRLPVPWYLRAWESLRERWLLYLLAAGLSVAAVGGMTWWVGAQPDVTLVGLARLTLERIAGLTWSAVLVAARFLWATGLPDAAAELARRIEPGQAILAMATLTVVSAGAGAAMAKLLQAPPVTAHARR